MPQTHFVTSHGNTRFTPALHEAEVPDNALRLQDLPKPFPILVCEARNHSMSKELKDFLYEGSLPATDAEKGLLLRELLALDLKGTASSINSGSLDEFELTALYKQAYGILFILSKMDDIPVNINNDPWLYGGRIYATGHMNPHISPALYQFLTTGISPASDAEKGSIAQELNKLDMSDIIFINERDGTLEDYTARSLRNRAYGMLLLLQDIVPLRTTYPPTTAV